VGFASANLTEAPVAQKSFPTTTKWLSDRGSL